MLGSRQSRASNGSQLAFALATLLSATKLQPATANIATSFFKEMGQEFEMPHELLLTAEKI